MIGHLGHGYCPWGIEIENEGQEFSIAPCVWPTIGNRITEFNGVWLGIHLVSTTIAHFMIGVGIVMRRLNLIGCAREMAI